MTFQTRNKPRQKLLPPTVPTAKRPLPRWMCVQNANGDMQQGWKSAREHKKRDTAPEGSGGF